MRATLEARPEPATVTASPGRTVPLATVPAKPLKSRFGRLTHCTGRRKGAPSAGGSTSAVSRIESRVPPRYQSIRPDRSDTLSPNRADTGTAVTAIGARSPAKARNSASMRVNTASS